VILSPAARRRKRRAIVTQFGLPSKELLSEMGKYNEELVRQA
jgi:hypothetical protein